MRYHTAGVAKGASARRAAKQATSSVLVGCSKCGRGGRSEGWFWGDIMSAKSWVTGTVRRKKMMTPGIDTWRASQSPEIERER